MTESMTAELTGLVESYDGTQWRSLGRLESVAVDDESVARLFGWSLPWTTTVKPLSGQPRGWPPRNDCSNVLKSIRRERPVPRGVTYLTEDELRSVNTDLLAPRYGVLVRDVVEKANAIDDTIRLTVFSTDERSVDSAATTDERMRPAILDEPVSEARSISVDNKASLDTIAQDSIMGEMPGVVTIVFDTTGICRHVAGEACSELAITRTDAVGAPVEELWPNGFGRDLSAVIDRTLSCGRRQVECQLLDRVFNVESVPIETEYETIGVCMTLSDITPQKRKRDRLQRVVDVITQIYTGFAIVHDGDCVYCDDEFADSVAPALSTANVGSVWDEFVTLPERDSRCTDGGAELEAESATMTINWPGVDDELLVGESEHATTKLVTLQYDDGTTTATSDVVVSFFDSDTYIVTPTT